MTNLQQITTFLLLAELSTFKKVADKLNLTPTAISKQIKSLEQSLDEQLFVRSTRKVELTEFGTSFYQHCLSLQTKMNELDQFIASRKVEPQGELKIVCSLTTGKDFLLEHLDEFSRLYPKISFSIEYTENTTGIRDENADIYFAYAMHAGVTDELRYRKLFSLKQTLVAAPEYLREMPKINEVADLMAHRFLTLDLRRPSNRFALEDGSMITTPVPFLVMNSFQALAQACANGMGVLLSADHFVSDYLEQAKLVTILPELDYKQFEIFIFYRSMQYEQPMVRAFIDFYTSKV